MTQPKQFIDCRARAVLNLMRVGRATLLRMGIDWLLFLEGKPVGAISGGYVYMLDAVYSAADTKAFVRFAAEADALDFPIVNVRVGEQFDFIVGSVLSKAGLPLTMRRD
jgi:hypothetical protein